MKTKTPEGTTVIMKSDTSNWSAGDFATIVRRVSDNRAMVTINGQGGGDEYVAFACEFEQFTPVQ